MPLHVFLGIGGALPYSIVQIETAALDELLERDQSTWQPGDEQYKHSFTGRAFDALMKELCVSRKGNRGHSLVGNDVHTMLQSVNRERLCALLEPR